MEIGKYRLIHKLATGGMAEVFLAKAAGPMGFEKLLVVKRILPHLATEPTFVEMFLTEARLAAQLNHPNIVQIFDFGESEGTYFLAMEYIDGPNLREIIRRSSAVGLALPLAFCARIVSAACEGLAFAHGYRDPSTRQPLNIIHRDISPDNILLSRQGAVKVVDFGIAKAAGLSPHTQAGVVKGKLAYMAPEQLRNEPLDPRADVYALGVVFYELLTGLKPFIATSDAGMVQAILFELQVPVLQRRPDVPEALQRILNRALAKERERRYPDCASFQTDLEEFILSTARPMGAPQVAQIVSMMTAGIDNPHPTVQTLSSAPSNPRLALPQRPLELTAAARPSQLILRNGAQAPQTSILQVAPPPESPPPQRQGRSEKEMVWVARAGILLFLLGSGLLIHRHSPRAGENPVPPPATPPVAPAPPVSAPASSGPSPSKPEPRLEEPGDVGSGAAPREAPPRPVPEGRKPSSMGSPRSSEDTEPPKAGQGTLDLRVVPEAKLFLNGWQMGPAPEKPFPLDAGQYAVRLVNDKLRKDVTRHITVAVGQTTQLEVNLLLEK
ncbi:serine/threonine protein kinase [Hyalangium gracile]|uniref:serine/threonine protein kinase n=1 Tax=Hyalangium gracile TaxID=394092 RepID=UPI001CCD4FD9|nr:serine/threonine-protein kinase [Hyalangium gracile]